MADLTTGADAVTGDKYSFQQMNRMKDHWRSATAPTAPVAGMIWSKTTDNTLWVYDGAAWIQVPTAESGEVRLVTTLAADMNPGAGTPVMTTLYTVPAGHSCIITRVVLRNSSGNLNTASISFGFDANGSDVIANATRTYLAGATNYGEVLITNGAIRGAAAGTFKLAVNTKQGGAMTIDIDVFGYLF